MDLAVDLRTPLEFRHGPPWRNRLMLGPLTNQQSLADGRMSDAEYAWLAMRAEASYAAMSTCAASVQSSGSALTGQLGIFSERHVDPLRRIAAKMKAHGNVAFTQLNHAGLRADAAVTGEELVGPFTDTETGGRALSVHEIQQLIEDYVVAAERADEAGFDGVEIHGAHGQIISQFLNPVRNLREDGYGGSLEDRSRIIREIIAGIRARCRPDFVIGLRLSTERFDITLHEMRQLSQDMMRSGTIDFLDLSLWDVFKEPEEEEFKGRPLIAWVTELERHGTRLGVTGKINSAARATACLAAGADFVLVARSGIIHHDFALQAMDNPDFVARSLPVSKDYLRAQGVSDPFIGYLSRWDNFVADAGPAMYNDLAGALEA